MNEHIDQNGESQKHTIEEAEIEIRAMLQDMAVAGAIDFEKSAVDAVLERLKEGATAPDNAIAEVLSIQEHRMDYH